MLDDALLLKIVRTLADVPGTENFAGRTRLLARLPQNVKSSIDRRDNARDDLWSIVNHLNKLGSLQKTGERPLIIVVQNALENVKGTELGDKLEELIQEIKHTDQEVTPSVPYPKIVTKPEITIFEGRDERLPYAFVTKAVLTGRSVTSLLVPRFIKNSWDDKTITGTGWLVTLDLLFTNHHVVAARLLDEGDEPASSEECKVQTEHARARFDYYVEGGERLEFHCVELVHSNVELDYALVRLDSAFKSHERKAKSKRQPLPIVRQRLPLSRKDRLNIVQYPNGGPLRYAIRNNFYYGPGNSNDFIQYITDTEGGSSGSPILNDSWQIVGMHHGHIEIKPSNYKGETIKYLNQGTLIHTILEDLPSSIRQEIQVTQGW